MKNLHGHPEIFLFSPCGECKKEFEQFYYENTFTTLCVECRKEKVYMDKEIE